jgi:hypothetical protein
MAVNKTFNDVKVNVAYNAQTSDVTTSLSPPEASSDKQHAGNIYPADATSATQADLAVAFGKIKDWYDKWHKVVWTGDAGSVGGHTVAVDVPSGAVFTDQKVEQKKSSANSSFPILLSAYTTSQDTTTATYTNRVATVYVNPSTGTITATNYVGKVNNHTINGDVNVTVPSDAVFTDTTYTLSGAYGTNNNTWVTTLTPSTGSATTSTVPTASTSVYGITKLSAATNSTSTTLAATASAVKAAYDLANGKSVVSFTQSLSSGTKIGTITIDGTATDLYAPSDTDTKVTQNILATSVADTYPLLVSYYKTGVTTTTAQTANRVQAIYVQPSTGTITATVFNENGTTLANKYATKNHNHNGVYVSVKPDGSNDLFDSNNIISSVYLPSYVDDVLEGYYKDGQFYPTDSTFTVTTSQPSNWATTYTNYFTRSGTSPNYVYTRLTSATAPTWAASTYYALSGTAMTGQSDTIYIDIGVDPAESYRWTGTTYASMKSPTIHAVADVVKKSNGVITKSYTDGTASADITVYEHPSTAGNKHIPSGGSTGQYLKYGGSSGTATWSSIGGSDVSVFTKATSSAAGTQGTVPAPAQSTYNANGNRHYLRSDGVWCDRPVTEYDTIQLNVV